MLPEEFLALQSLYEVGTSAGEQHPKVVIAVNEEPHDIRSRQVELLRGYTYLYIEIC